MNRSAKVSLIDFGSFGEPKIGCAIVRVCAFIEMTMVSKGQKFKCNKIQLVPANLNPNPYNSNFPKLGWHENGDIFKFQPIFTNYKGINELLLIGGRKALVLQNTLVRCTHLRCDVTWPALAKAKLRAVFTVILELVVVVMSAARWH